MYIPKVSKALTYTVHLCKADQLKPMPLHTIYTTPHCCLALVPILQFISDNRLIRHCKRTPTIKNCCCDRVWKVQGQRSGNIYWPLSKINPTIFTLHNYSKISLLKISRHTVGYESHTFALHIHLHCTKIA